jgi:hypothetical protein
MGKKSDILLLYSVAIILFIIIGIAFAFENLIGRNLFLTYSFYIITILVAFSLMLISLDFSSKKLALNYNFLK